MDPADRLSHQQERPSDAGSQAVSDQIQRLLTSLEAAWSALGDAYAGLSDGELVEPGVVDVDFPPLAGHRGYAARVDASGWS